MCYIKRVFNKNYDGECLLFPSKDQRDWSKFNFKKPKQPRFDPKTLQPFNNVLVRDDSSLCWVAQLFSHIIECKKNYPYLCTNGSNRYCIPYNDDTKHLVGTTEEAPEFYRYDLNYHSLLKYNVKMMKMYNILKDKYIKQ